MTRNSVSVLVCVAALGVAAHAACAAPKDGRRLVWGDEFSGSSLDQTKWKFHRTMNSTDCVYTNDERTARVEDGCLHLLVVPSGDPKKPQMLPRGVSTRDRMAFRYGYLEMRAKVPFRHGAWPSFWMTAQPSLQKAAWMSEVDIFEVFSSSNAVVANLHKWAGRKGRFMLPGGEGSLKRAYMFKDCTKLNDEFHVYGFEWTPKEMSFFVDGEKYVAFPIDEAHDYCPEAGLGMAGFHDFHNIHINNEIFTPGHGWCPDEKRITAEDKLPIEYWVDWMRLYQKDGEEMRKLPLAAGAAPFKAVVSPVEGDATATLQKAFDDCWRAGGGTVTVEKGEYAVRGLRLRSGTTLLLKSGAVLRASRDCDEYGMLADDVLEPVPKGDFAPGVVWVRPAERKTNDHMLKPASRWNNAVIRILNARNVRIVGEPGSAIDGCDSYDPKGEEHFRGVHGISVHGSTNLVFSGYTIRNTGNWAHNVWRCADLRFENLTILGGHDGIHFSTCDRVSISGCMMKTGDDCVAGFDNEDVAVRGCELNTACSAFRFGGRRVLIENCRCWGPGEYPIRNSLPMADRISGSHGKPGVGRRTMLSLFTYYSDFTIKVRHAPGDIVVRDCSLENSERFLHYNFSGNETWQKNRPLGSIRFEGVTARGVGMSLCAYGDAGERLSLALENCRISFSKKQAEFVRGAHIRSLLLRDVSVEGVDGPCVRSWGDVAAPDVRGSSGVGSAVEAASAPFVVKPI